MKKEMNVKDPSLEITDNNKGIDSAVIIRLAKVIDDYSKTCTKTWGVGDIVTKDGSDKQKIVSIDHYWDVFEVECILEPREPWIKLGERETNLCSKYTLVEKYTEER